MPGPTVLTPLVDGEVVEVRTYAVWQDQEYITKFYWRIAGDGGIVTKTTADLLAIVQGNWQNFVSPLLPTDWIVRQYWAGIVFQVTRSIVPPRPWTTTYSNQTVIIGAALDAGSSVETEWLPTIDAATMNRFGQIRNKNWRSNVRFGPVPETNQNSGLLSAAAIAIYNTNFESFAKGPLWGVGINTVIPTAAVFSPALGVGELINTMSNATQDITEWRASKLVGTQRTRKIRAAGY